MPADLTGADPGVYCSECGEACAIAEFENAGTSRPVKLTADERAGLLGVIVAWAGEADGLPEGIAELRDAMKDDLPDS